MACQRLRAERLDSITPHVVETGLTGDGAMGAFGKVHILSGIGDIRLVYVGR